MPTRLRPSLSSRGRSASRLCWGRSNPWSSRTPITTWAGGAKAWQKTDWGPLAGRTVSLLADADTEGRDAACGIAAALHKLDCTVSLHLPEGESHEDVADWIAEQGPEKALHRIKSESRDFDPESDAPPEDEAAAKTTAETELGRLPDNSALQVGIDLARELAGQFLFVPHGKGGQWFAATSTKWESCPVVEATGAHAHAFVEALQIPRLVLQPELPEILPQGVQRPRHRVSGGEIVMLEQRLEDRSRQDVLRHHFDGVVAGNRFVDRDLEFFVEGVEPFAQGLSELARRFSIRWTSREKMAATSLAQVSQYLRAADPAAEKAVREGWNRPPDRRSRRR